MQGASILLLTTIFTVLVLIIQRTEAKYRLLVTLLFFGTAGLLLRDFAISRQLEREAWLAFFLGLFLNFLFWVLIGRYNPVHSSDEIQVLGMDD